MMDRKVFADSPELINMRFLDLNGVMKQDNTWTHEDLFKRIKECHRHMATGAVLVHCKQGANRATLFAVCLLIARTECSVESALSHVKALRHLTVINHPAEKRPKFPDPIKFLNMVHPELIRLCIDLGLARNICELLHYAKMYSLHTRIYTKCLDLIHCIKCIQCSRCRQCVLCTQ